MEQIEPSRYKRTAHSASSGSRRPFPQIAIAFGVGAVCTALILVALRPQLIDQGMSLQEIRGTIGSHWQGADLIESFRMEEEITGALSTIRSGESIGFRMDLSSSAPFQTLIQYDAGQLQFAGLRTMDSGRIEFQNSHGTVQTLHPQSGSVLLMFRAKTDDPEPLEVQILSGDHIVLKRAFELIQYQIDTHRR